MRISEALRAAADHIERYPEKYNFMCGGTPFHGEQACMLGRFAQVAGIRHGVSVDLIAQAILGQAPTTFYREIAEAAGVQGDEMRQYGIVNSAKHVPNAMRKVAQKYEGIPQSVCELFEGNSSRVLAQRYGVVSGGSGGVYAGGNGAVMVQL